MSIQVSLISAAIPPMQNTAAFPRDADADPALLARVAEVAAALGRIDRVWTAPELRAQQTAAYLDPGAFIVPALRDCDFGLWQGQTLADINSNDPKGVARWLSDVDAQPHGGETLSSVMERIGDWLERHREPGHTVAVTHPGVIRAAIVRCLGAPPSGFWRIDVEPLSVADLRRNGERWALRSIGPARQ